MNQTIDKGTSGTAWSTKTLAACLMVVATLLAACLMAAQPAQASTTLVVNSTADFHDTIVGDGFCGFGGSCSLRAAIEEANFTPGADTINFNIPGTGVKTIAVGASSLGFLPPITDPVTIDGYTQPGASPNTLAKGDNAVLKIELNGASPNFGHGLLIKGPSGGSVIKGLVINRFGEGISIEGDTAGNRVEGNFIGTDPSGTLDRGNTDDGVNLLNGPSGNVVGGTAPAARNIISGNTCNAVLVSGAGNNRIQGNYVGTDKSGTKALANGDLICTAVFINDAPGNTVGGTTAGARNVISGNKAEGVGIFGGSQDNEVLGNRIGTTANGSGPLGNGEAGVFIRGSHNSVGNGTAAGSNTIAFNGKDGVEVAGNLGLGNEISRNSIFSNVGIGIDLVGGVEDAQGNTANDAGDIDDGPNDLQNKPVLSSAKTVSGKTTVKGTLNTRTDFGYVIRFFSNPSGTNEGKKFIGQKTVLPDPSSGNATFTFSPASAVAVGQTITATATTNSVRVHQTSEFSAARKVASS